MVWFIFGLAVGIVGTLFVVNWLTTAAAKKAKATADAVVSDVKKL